MLPELEDHLTEVTEHELRGHRCRVSQLLRWCACTVQRKEFCPAKVVCQMPQVVKPDQDHDDSPRDTRERPVEVIRLVQNVHKSGLYGQQRPAVPNPAMRSAIAGRRVIAEARERAGCARTNEKGVQGQPQVQFCQLQSQFRPRPHRPISRVQAPEALNPTGTHECAQSGCTAAEVHVFLNPGHEAHRCRRGEGRSARASRCACAGLHRKKGLVSRAQFCQLQVEA
jgi:hypothetical protein